MRNRLFVPDFLFDFYAHRGSIGTPSALSNVNRAGLRKFCAQPTSRKPRELIFGSLVVSWASHWYSSKHLLYSIYFADRWRCKCAVRTTARKNVQVGKFDHPSLPHRTSYQLRIYKFARDV